MAQKIVNVPGIGDVLLAKRRGSKNLRLSVLPDGRVRVGLPAWAPYSAGINFAKNRSDWVKKHSVSRDYLKHGDQIGKSYRLYFQRDASHINVSTRVTSNAVIVRTALEISNPDVQQKASLASERALKKEAERLLPQRLDTLALVHNLPYKSLRIKKLSSRWGSCSNSQQITLNFFLIQLPWHLIDYVIIHELLHTKYLNHGDTFWSAYESIRPEAKKLRREINQLRPILTPKRTNVA
ncbi:MAG TPA: SprT family zinc-dependent metalloprotease [Candidatus Saccharimonadales bacterium]|nr:SprT family zinc-dependent metalloprotease [Candidatus Saccharimonadales bacterium]